MALEASIVERLQELRRWQVEQQARLLQHQQEQRETLSREQVRMYQALGLSVGDAGKESGTEPSFQDSLEQNEAAKTDLGTRRYENLLKTNLADLGSPGHMSPQRRHELLHNSGLRVNCQPEIVLPADQPSRNLENGPSDTCGVNPHREDIRLINFNDPEDEVAPSLEHEVLEVPGNIPDSFIEGVEPLRAEQPTRKSLMMDDVPVPSPRKDFHTLLEERLKEAQYATGDDKPVNVKPVKRPFLRKGQGLARFRLGAVEESSKRQIRPRTMSLPSTVRMENGKGGKMGADRANEAPKAGKGRANRQEKPQKKLVPVPGRAQSRLSLKNVQPPVRIRSKSMCNPREGQIPAEERAKLNDSFNNSDIESKTKRELEEVRIFELLEEKAENSSFCSTSSTVVALLQQSVQSTPLKNKNLNKNRVSTLAQNWRNSRDDNSEDLLLAEIVYTTQSNSSTTYKKHFQNDSGNLPQAKDSGPETDRVFRENVANDNICELPYGTDVDSDYGADFPETNHTGKEDFDPQVNYEKNTSLHVRFSEYNEYKTLTDTSTISNDSEAPRHYSDQRAWSDCSVTTDSSDAEEFASIIEEHDKILSPERQESLKNKSKYKDRYHEEITTSVQHEDHSDSEPYNYPEASDSASEQDKNENSGDTEVSVADSTLVEEELGPAKKQEDNGLVFKSELLKTRLLELEGEIEIFRKENIALTTLKEKLQEERRALERSFKEKEGRFEEKKQKMEAALQEEKKRLAREKSALENRLKDAQVKAQQSKQERLEAQCLREQLEELREEINQKESRWNAAQARHRSQVRILQAENSKLKQDLEKLQTARKATTKARLHARPPSSNTKAIHQINKQLESQKQAPGKQDSSSDEEELLIQPMMEAMNFNQREDDQEFGSINSDGSRMIVYDRPQTGLKSKNCTARKRDLYENLLKDATIGLKEGEEATKRAVQSLDNKKNSSKLNEQQMRETGADNTSEDLREDLVSGEIDYPDQENPLEDYKKSLDYKDGGKVDKQGIREVQHPDGRAEFWYPNGNVKKISADGTITKLIYYNGDVCESRKDGSVKYFYATTRTWHTTMSDGLEILEFPDGQVERRSKDGTVEVSFPDGTVRILQSNGTEKWALPDGTLAETSSDGEKILILPNGQREVHTKEHKRREYPDGTVKLVYPDGSQETRYAGGRVRLKDKDGNLLMDSHHQ